MTATVFLFGKQQPLDAFGSVEEEQEEVQEEEQEEEEEEEEKLLAHTPATVHDLICYFLLDISYMRRYNNSSSCSQGSLSSSHGELHYNYNNALPTHVCSVPSA
jgi:hypothetical protein